MQFSSGLDSPWRAFEGSEHTILLLAVGIPFCSSNSNSDGDSDSDDNESSGGQGGSSDGVAAMTIDTPPPDPVCDVYFMILRQGKNVKDAPVAMLPLPAVLAHYDTLEADFEHNTGLPQPDFMPVPQPPAPLQLSMPYAEDLLEHRPRAWLTRDARWSRQWRNPLSQYAGIAESRATIAGVKMYRVVAPSGGGQCQVPSFICDSTLLGDLMDKRSAGAVD
jgi:hypothetical protein